MLQMHCWDDGTPIEETLGALRDLVNVGKVHYVGVSNATGWQFQKIVDKAKDIGLTAIVSIQVGGCSQWVWLLTVPLTGPVQSLV